MLPCSAVLKGEYGYNKLSMTVPAIIGKEGIREIEEWPLAPDEQAELAISTTTIASSNKIVEESLGIVRD
jgi:malate dehydrogenase